MPASIDAAFEALKNYGPGSSRAALLPIDEAVVAALPDPAARRSSIALSPPRERDSTQARPGCRRAEPGRRTETVTMKLILIVAAAFSLAEGPALSAASSPAKPNIIFLLADDLRWDALSCAGNPVLKTPNVDRLAAQGTRFTNAFLTTAICCVSRASILSGQYARRHGVNDFRTPLRSFAETYPAQLRAADYYTGFIGKWGVAAANRQYFQQCAAAFDFWAGDMGQSSYWHARTCNYLVNRGPDDRTDFFCSCPPAARQREGVEGTGPHPALSDPVHAETEFVPAKIRSFLDQRSVGKPFCLSVSFKAPHGPWGGFAPRFARDFEGVAIPRAESVSEAEALRQPKFLRASLGSKNGLCYAQDASLDGERNRQLRNAHQDRLRQLRQQHRQFAATLE